MAAMNEPPSPAWLSGPKPYINAGKIPTQSTRDIAEDRIRLLGLVRIFSIFNDHAEAQRLRCRLQRLIRIYSDETDF